MNTIQIQGSPISLNGQSLTGFNSNFDLGGSTAQYAQQAYNFLNANNVQDQAFLGNTMAGSANFLNYQLSPIAQGIAAQQQLNAQMLPAEFSAFNNMQSQIVNQNYQFANNALNSINQNTMMSSNAAANSGGGGGCYITTAICQYENLADDCKDIQTLRRYRDDFLMANPKYKIMVKEYYEIAPAIVCRLEEMPPDYKDTVYRDLRKKFLTPAIEAINAGHNALALYIYKQMVDYAIKASLKNHLATMRHNESEVA